MLGPSRRPPLPASTSSLNSAPSRRATYAYAEQDRTEPSEEWKLELKVKIEAALEEIFKEAKASPVKEPEVKIAVFVVQIEGNKALAHRQYESNLEQEHLQLPTPISRPLYHKRTSILPAIPTTQLSAGITSSILRQRLS
jgi:hypothetical protein